MFYLSQFGLLVVRRHRHVWTNISRSEQAQISGFCSRDKSDRSGCGFLGSPWCNEKVDPDIYVSYGSYGGVQGPRPSTGGEGPWCPEGQDAIIHGRHESKK